MATMNLNGHQFEPGSSNLVVNMEKFPFIFSDKRSYRLKRHLLFWVSWWLFSGFLYSFVGAVLNFAYLQRLSVSLIESFVFLTPHVFLAYTLMYYVVPRFLLKSKYLQAALITVGLIFITGCLSALISIYVLNPVRLHIFNIRVSSRYSYELGFHIGLMAGLRGGITVCGIATAIKLTKYWYAKEQRNLQLQKENISSQLELLKGQVHPHFLFNTLNNIYSTTQGSSPTGAKMILGLSELLRYMLYECNQPSVLLSRELSMLQEYISLEKTRYDNGLDLHIDLPQKETGLMIAPLILLPFVENCFKHGTSNMLEQPWISLQITIENDWLKMKLLNGKVQESEPSKQGIGLTNAKKRLELIYPAKHELTITDEDEVFVVNLKLLLKRVPVTHTIIEQSEVYA